MKLKKKLAKMVELLNGPYPGDDLECEKCAYFDGRNKIKKR